MSNPVKVQTMCPYLVLKGAAAAIDFYVTALGAREIFRLTDPGDGRVGHAELAIGGQRFFLADEYPDFGAIGPDRLGGTTVKFHLEVEDVDRFVEHAVAHGADVLRAPKQEFHGYRSALLADPFGYAWFAAQKLEDVNADEMQRRWTEMMAGAGEGMMTELDEFAAIEDAFSAAMVSNDVARIAGCISDDWVLVTPEVGPVSREGMLEAIGNGRLTHDMMVKQLVRAKVYGDMAVVTGRGQNTGTFRGEPIAADEWITDIYRKVDGRWLCVLTHLTPAKN